MLYNIMLLISVSNGNSLISILVVVQRDKLDVTNFTSIFYREYTIIFTVNTLSVAA